MSCLLEQVASISNTSEVVRWLCPHLVNSAPQPSPLSPQNPTEITEADWSEDWGKWEDEDDDGEEESKPGTSGAQPARAASSNTPSSQAEINWVSECIISVSPTCNLMAIAYKNRLAFFSCRWESNGQDEEKMSLVNTWRGTLGFSTGDEISALLCLPLIYQSKSSTGGPDWTCVIVGFTSGYVAMYTETGLLLLSQMFEDGEVVSVKCHTGPPRHALIQDLKELVILYPKAITTIDGFSLLQTLRGCRNQVAKAAASGDESVSLPLLGFKKWGLVDQSGLVNDCSAPDLAPSCLYDHIARISYKGFGHSYSTVIPVTSQLITAGREPFMGFLTAQEGSAPPFVADVARLFANKLKDTLVSAASGFLFGKGKVKEPEPKVEPATPLSYSWCIPDRKRCGVKLCLAGGQRLAAVTDDIGRVLLIDVKRGVALRMWKGYRDAECGWVEVRGVWGGSRRTTSFLLIYAPRRGLLEVWTPQQGPRIAAFNVPKYSRLLYTQHTLLGNHTMRGNSCKIFPVIFITPDGTMSEVVVPFHLALGGKTSRRSRDLHLLKSLKAHLRNGKEEVISVLSEIKTLGVRRQAVNMLITSTHINITLLQDMLNVLLPLYPEKEEGVEGRKLNHEGLLFRQQLVRLNQLVHLYRELEDLHVCREASPDPEHEDLIRDLAKLLVLTPDETKEVLVNCGQKGCFSHNTRKVKFSDKCTGLSVGSFLRCWDTKDSPFVKETSTALPLCLKEDLNEEKKLRLGEFLYGWAWRSLSMKKFKELLGTSGCDPEALLHIALSHWLQNTDTTTVAALHFGTILNTLAVISEETIACSISEQSPWWSRVRDKLEASTNPQQSYLAALLCRGIHASLEARNQDTQHRNGEEMKEGSGEEMEEGSGAKTESGNVEKMEKGNEEEEKCMELSEKPEGEQYSSLNDWEGLSMEMTEWNLLLSQLSCIIPLSQLLAFTPSNTDTLRLSSGGSLPRLKREVSIKILLDQGRGYVAELIATWFIASGLPLSTIVKILNKQDEIRKKMQQDLTTEIDEDTTVIDDADLDQETCKEDVEVENPECKEISELLRKVGEHFPNSVAGDSVLTNMTWELANGWFKSPDHVSLLTRAVEHLATIANSHIRHGVGVMIWDTWVGRWIQSAMCIIEKAGKTPREEACQRELRLSDHNLPPALHSAANLLNQIMEANVVCEVEKPVVLTGDRLWSGHEGSPALVEVTITQKATCYDLIYLHHQLITVLRFIALHNVKKLRPLTCFDGKGRSALFKDLSTSWTFGGQADMGVTKVRTMLLCKVITAAVVSLPDATLPSQAVSTSVRDALELGRAWGVGVDALRRHHICELYNSGFDSLGEELLSTVNDNATLGSQLVLLAGQRLHHLLLTSPRTAHHLALTSPTITEWVKSCNANGLRCPSVAVEDTVELLTRALNLLPETSPEHKIATGLYQTLTAFVQDQQT